jgi:DNA replication and repair protein RecF
MRVRAVHLKAFRNHVDSQLFFSPRITLLLGDNGQGKTNVLEAISYVSLSKSFYAASDAQVVMLGQSALEIHATMENTAGRESEVRVVADTAAAAKVVQVNGRTLDRLSDLVGMFPAVILSPEQGKIVAGGPSDRRKFLDLVLCQTSRTYLADALEYRRVLRQRNKLLLDARIAGTTPARELPAWTDELVHWGSRLVARRAALVHQLGAAFGSTYGELTGGPSDAAIQYMTVDGVAGEMASEEIALHMQAALERRSGEERRRGSTLVGPHRDDLAFTIHGMLADRYASQGEQKTLLIALKFLEYDYVTSRCGETPILLLDDVFAELDRNRATHVMDRLAGRGQCIITATDESLIGNGMRWESDCRRIVVERGTCHETPF